MKELIIYRNGDLHCIVPKDRAKITLESLRKCYPKEKWEMRDMPEKEREK